MTVNQEQTAAALPHWKGNASTPPRALAFRVETPIKKTSWSRIVFTITGGIAVVLLIAAVSIPNLLRSRFASTENAQSATGLSDDSNDARMMTFLTTSAPVESTKRIGGATVGVTPRSVTSLPTADLPVPNRLISYQVTMTLEVKEFDAAKAQLRQIMDAEGGYVAQANFVERANQPRQANLVLRIPAARLATILSQVRELGRVREEHLSSEEVTDQVVDLEARLKNARATEQRLIDVLNNRTGKVGDILQVEQEIARTREQIERMEAQRQNLLKRVEMATITLTLAEEFKAELQPAPAGTLRQLWNALVDGWENFSGSILAIVLFFARYGLTLALWGGLGWGTYRLLRGTLQKLVRHGE